MALAGKPPAGMAGENGTPVGIPTDAPHMITDEQANERMLWICVAVALAVPAVAAILSLIL
jgi:hypothetical protein